MFVCYTGTTLRARNALLVEIEKALLVPGAG